MDMQVVPRQEKSLCIDRSLRLSTETSPGQEGSGAVVGNTSSELGSVDTMPGKKSDVHTMCGKNVYKCLGQKCEWMGCVQIPQTGKGERIFLAKANAYEGAEA